LTANHAKYGKQKLKRLISHTDKLHLPGGAMISGNALFVRVFRVFRGFNCFFQVYTHVMQKPGMGAKSPLDRLGAASLQSPIADDR